MDAKNIKEHKKSKCRRILKTGCLSVVVLFLVLVLAATAWFFYVTSGVEVHDEHLIYEPVHVPDEENGYFTLESVRQAITNSELDFNVFCVTNDILSDETLSALDSFEKKYPSVLDSLYSVAQYEFCQVPLDDGIPWIMQNHVSVSGLISLSQVSLCHIRRLIQQGEMGSALECLGSHLRIGQMINADAHNLLTGVLGFVLAKTGSDLLIDHLSDGTFSSEYKGDVQSLFVLLRDRSDWEQMVRSEYSYVRNTLVSQNKEDAYSEGFRRRQYRFLYNESVTLKWMEICFSKMLKSCRDPSVEQAVCLIESEPSLVQSALMFFSGNYAGQMYYAIFMPSTSVGHRILVQKANVELIGLYLAMWDYYEENGELPDELMQLVPDYLSELPVDPFGEGGSFLYDSQEKVIRSVGAECPEKKKSLEIRLGFVD